MNDETESQPAPSQLRRLPWREDGKDAYLSTGEGSSFLARMADSVEEGMLTTAEVDMARALSVADEMSSCRAELRMAVRFLAHAAADAVEVARLRGERLGVAPEAKETAEFVRRCITP
ncbi:hypothetical protein [Streptomyces althioticus]|uniref:hypothetical protein n=1 Tax=Streptomyces althioticus TaxID=83380 RepID=UPI00332ED00F